jgi:hypothetical protein
VERLGENRLGVGRLDEGAQVHHRHPAADVPDHGEVVADEQVRQPELPLQIQEQVQDLGLDGDVQGRDRLVGDDQFGLAGQGASDADALALAAGELVGIPRRVGRIQSDLGQKPLHAALPLQP